MQPYRKDVLSVTALCPDLSVVFADDALCDGQAEPVAAGARPALIDPVKALKDFFQIFL